MPVIVTPVADLVSEIREPIPTTVPLDDHIKALMAEDRSVAIAAAVAAWKATQDKDRDLRHHYAYLLIWGLLIQSLTVNVAFFLIGLEKLKVDETTSRIFICAVFTEIAAMVFFIVKYLFSRDDSGFFRLIEKLYDSK
jgi:hypothetical protein